MRKNRRKSEKMKRNHLNLNPKAGLGWGRFVCVWSAVGAMRQTGAWSEVESNKLNSYELCGRSALKFWGFKRVFASFNVSMSPMCVCVCLCVLRCRFPWCSGWYLSPLCKLQSSLSPTLCPCARLTYAPYHIHANDWDDIHTEDTTSFTIVIITHAGGRKFRSERNKSFSYLHFVFITFLALAGFSCYSTTRRQLLTLFFSLFDFSTLHIPKVEPGAICRLIVVCNSYAKWEKSDENQEIHFFPNFRS